MRSTGRASTGSALDKTFELFAVPGGEAPDWEGKFGALAADRALDGPLDRDTMPLEDEPDTVRRDLKDLHAHARRDSGGQRAEVDTINGTAD